VGTDQVDISSASFSATIAQQTWELENNIVSMDGPFAESDSIYYYDEVTQKKIQQAAKENRGNSF
jgi:COP9 signalosome complex subunit 5